jgi:hypothetical protein
MAGSWEIINQTQVLTVILTREMVASSWAASFKHLQIPGTYTFLSGMPFDHARNTGCIKTLELDFEWLFFLDDDTIPPWDAIPKLMSHKKPIVSGLYYRRSPPICPVMLKNTPNGRQWVTEFNSPSLIEVDFVGAGCLLINKEVLKKLNYPWFEWKVDRYDLPPDQRMSEDFSFCEKARQQGYKIYVDTGVQCRHIGLGESRIGGQFVPAEIII